VRRHGPHGLYSPLPGRSTPIDKENDMNSPHLNPLFRLLTGTRRALLGGAAMIAAGRSGAPNSAAKKKHRKKPTLNRFGCVDVGNPCLGNDALCCSGFCLGQKSKKGKRDRSRCVAHHADICQPGQLSIPCGGTDETTALCTLPNGEPGLCERTTGNASYCAGSFNVCAPCGKDADCHAVCGAGAACITCAGCAEGTACVGLDIELCDYGI
jgi:hypothetical protein